MSNKLDYIQKICEMVRDQSHAAYPALDLHFIIHPPGHLAERLPLAEDKVRKHRAFDGARTILSKMPMIERSSLLGIAMKTGAGLFGLGKRHSFLALININMDDIDDSRQARHLAYHLAWHAIDLMQYRLDPKNMERLQDGPMVPKRAPIGLAYANLKADIFATSMNYLQGNKKALSELAATRATQSIIPFRSHRVEDFPYVIAAEATQYALSDLEKRGLPAASQMVKKAHTLSQEISAQFQENHIKQWHAFASPAQNMAWAGHPGEEILGAAVNTSENPYIRSTGYLVAQFADIAPLSASTMMSRYNSFTSFERNERLHKERMEHIFEAALSKSLIEETASPLKDAANLQNEQLADGTILGWCAGALQIAGDRFISSLPAGKDKAADVARHTFQDQKEQSHWSDIVALGDKIIDEKRKGYTVTLGQINELCADEPRFAGMRQSVQATLQDPAYAQRLEAANDLNFTPAAPAAPRAAPRSPAPKGPAPQAPIPFSPAGPGLGGSSQMVRARELTRQKRLAEQQAQEKQE